MFSQEDDSGSNCSDPAGYIQRNNITVLEYQYLQYIRIYFLMSNRYNCIQNFPRSLSSHGHKHALRSSSSISPPVPHASTQSDFKDPGQCTCSLRMRQQSWSQLLWNLGDRSGQTAYWPSLHKRHCSPFFSHSRESSKTWDQRAHLWVIEGNEAQRHSKTTKYSASAKQAPDRILIKHQDGQKVKVPLVICPLGFWRLKVWEFTETLDASPAVLEEWSQGDKCFKIHTYVGKITTCHSQSPIWAPVLDLAAPFTNTAPCLWPAKVKKGGSSPWAPALT